MTTPFDKPYSELDDDEKKLVDTASEVLSNGDRLYGLTPLDYSHVWWAVGSVLATLRDTHQTLHKNNDQDPTVVGYLELGIDDNGFFISVLSAESDEPKQDSL